MHESGSHLYFCARILVRSCCFQSVYAENSFDARSPWMLGDWNGQRTAQQQGYTCEMAALLDAKHASSRGTEYADQFAFGAPLDLEKILGWRVAEAQLTVADFRCLKRAFEFCTGSLGATPMTYEAGGKQYVVIMAGGHSSFGTKMGDALVAYALPDQK